MDGSSLGNAVSNAMTALFVIGILAGIVVALLFYGGCKLVSKYTVKVEKKPAVSTVVVTNYVTNYVGGSK